MPPSPLPEVRIARRVLLALYLLLTFGLCAATTVGIVTTLARRGDSPPGNASRGALGSLRSLFEEMRQRAENLGRNNPRKPLDLGRWQSLASAWSARLDRLAMRHSLEGPDVPGDDAATSLRRAYRAIRKLLGAYAKAVRSLADARQVAIAEVAAELRRAAGLVRRGGTAGGH